MLTYLVGGAVRDTLLQRPVKEKDYVVINETPQSMLDRGFKQVGKDFPVFLHPQTHEEYALARKERKTDTGHHGFQMDIDQVSLAEDLQRRDLTINAIARSETGEIIDPYHGEKDLQQKVLKHVSSAFIEDPLRVLRVARFQAMLPDFTIDKDTLKLMITLCNTPGEISSLPKERIWNEVKKAAIHPGFPLFWQTLDKCDCLKALSLSAGQQFLEDLSHSSATDSYKLLSALWRHPNPLSFLSLRPPSDIANGIKLIHAERETILKGKNNSAHSILQSLQRLDPFRRKERAILLIKTLPDATLTKFWNLLIEGISSLDLSSIIQHTEKHLIADKIQTARLTKIMHLLENK